MNTVFRGKRRALNEWDKIKKKRDKVVWWIQFLGVRDEH
jgi:hypothetical protein